MEEAAQRDLWEGETLESIAAEEAELCQRLMDSEGSQLPGVERLVASNELRVPAAKELRTRRALRLIVGRFVHEA